MALANCRRKTFGPIKMVIEEKLKYFAKPFATCATI